MCDIQAVAFQADLTRVATLMIGREGSLRTYPEIGVPDPHHPLTHHRNNPEWIEKITKVNTFHMELFAKFIGKLRATPGWRRHGARSLDHRLRQRHLRRHEHTHEDLPVLLVGGGGGSCPGRHVVYADDTPMTNLYLTLLDRIGVRQETIGDSTGQIAHLAAI